MAPANSREMCDSPPAGTAIGKKEPTRFVGVAGNCPGAGKDTVADMLVAAREEPHPGDARVVRRAFADPLRECLFLIHGVAPAESRTREGKARVLPDGDTVGRALQKIGAAVRNVVGADSWVRAAMRDLPEHNHLVVFSDVRYPNEALAIRERGGVVFWVERPEANPEEGGAPAKALAGRDPHHESEQLTPESAGADAVIVNDGTLEALGAKVFSLITEHDLA